MKIVPGLLVKVSDGHVFVSDPNKKRALMVGSAGRYRVLAVLAESKALMTKNGDLLITPEGVLAGHYIFPVGALDSLEYCMDDEVTAAWLGAE